MGGKNRTLSILAGDAGRPQAIRVTFDALPAPFDVWNGRQLWADNPFEVCEVAAIAPPQPCPAGAPRTRYSRLICEQQCKTDWASQGVIHLYHEGIVPGGRYIIDVLECCPGGVKIKSPPLVIVTPKWGDVGGPFSGGQWSAPNGSVDITTDVVMILEKFGNRGGAPIKSRVDIEPNCLDFKINITDAVRDLDAFRGAGYPFRPKVTDPCLSPCP
jgi:hypothetical protein